MSERNEVQSYIEQHEAWKREAAVRASWVDPIRTRALARFESIGFPKPRDEEWRQTNLARLRRVAFHLSRGTAGPLEKSGAGRFLFGGEAAAELVFVNGRFAPDLSLGGGLPEGTVVERLATALAGREAILREHLGRYADYETGSFAAWNTAFLADGAFVSIPGGRKVEKPIHIVYLCVAEEEPFVVHPRNLILLGAGAEATIIESYASLSESVYLTNAVSEIRLGEGASLLHMKLQEENEKAFHVGALQVHQEARSRFHSLNLAFGAALSRCDIGSVLGGEGIECVLDGLYVGRGDQLMDSHTVLEHASPSCGSREHFKGILTERARGVFSGKIVVRPGAQKTDAKQTNQALLLSDDAAVHAKPQLEIYADDVKCTHGATVGRLDEEAVFYIRSRGIEEAAARGLLTFAFAGDLVERIEFTPFRTRVEDLLTERLPLGRQIRGAL
jgi:Fe-S cluster assembly protein SufD